MNNEEMRRVIGKLYEHRFTLDEWIAKEEAKLNAILADPPRKRPNWHTSRKWYWCLFRGFLRVFPTESEYEWDWEMTDEQWQRFGGL